MGKQHMSNHSEESSGSYMTMHMTFKYIFALLMNQNGLTDSCQIGLLFALWMLHGSLQLKNLVLGGSLFSKEDTLRLQGSTAMDPAHSPLAAETFTFGCGNIRHVACCSSTTYFELQ
ncbi:hypothetical protein YC2023_086273 [Brassica napus]